MRAVLQRVKEASVSVEGREIGRIASGLLVFVGLAREDDEKDLRWMAEKIIGLRVFSDHEGRMNLDVSQAGGSLLLISQFTLMGDARKGRRPGYDTAMSPDEAREAFERFVSICREGPVPVDRGIFQAMMEVSLVNDGPVTILLDSKKLF